FNMLPPGAIPSPAQASPLVIMLPYFEQANKYNQFDMSQNVNTSASNAAARSQDMPILLCPSDPGQSSFTVTVGGKAERGGRTNYHASLGGNGWWRNKDAATGGVFYFASPQNGVRITDITDGSSNTAMYAEIKRGMDGAHPELRVTSVPFSAWDAALPGSDL